MFSPPWTEIGRIQTEVDSLKSELRGKVDNHELHSTKSTLARLEHSLGAIHTEVDGLCARIEALERASEEES